MMAGTIIITGANSSLAIPAVVYLLTNYPDYTVILTVRDDSTNDINTGRLRRAIEPFADALLSIRQLDLARLSAVHEFAALISADILAKKLPPLAALVCNAYYWNLKQGTQMTEDGYEKSFQVSHLAHVVLTLRLLGSSGPQGARIVLFSSDAHMPGKNGLEKYPPALPDDLELLVKPTADDPPDDFGHGFQRYANSKLAIVSWMYALNHQLLKDPRFSKTTAVAINPGNLPDSRALRVNTPSWLYYMSFLIRVLRALLHYFVDPTMRTAAMAGVDVIDLATNKAHSGERGYFTLLKKDVSSPESQDQTKQQRLWEKSLVWTGISSQDTVVRTVYD